MYASAIMAIWSDHDPHLWLLMLNIFSAMLTYIMNIMSQDLLYIQIRSNPFLNK